MADTINSLSIQIGVDANAATGGLVNLTNTLRGLKSAAAPVVRELDKLRSSLQSLKGIKVSINAAALTTTLKQISDAAKQVSEDDIARLKGVGGALTKLSANLAGISSVNAETVTAFASSVSSVATALGNTGSLNSETVDSFTSSVTRLCAAFRNMGSINAADLTSFTNVLQGMVTNFSNMESLNTGALNAFASAVSSVTNVMAKAGQLNAANADAIMGTVSGLTAACRSITDSDIERLRALADALREVREAGGMENVVAGANAGAAGGVVDEAASFSDRLKAALSGPVSGGVAGAMKTAYSGVSNVIKGVGNSIHWLNEKLNPMNTALGTFIKGLGRIAMYRFLRTVIKAFTQGASEGLQNLAHASEEANQVLTRLSSAALTMKNALGGALYSAIEPNIELLTTLANTAIKAMNALSQLFAILGGRSTYMQAVWATDEFKDNLNNAHGSAKKLRQELMAFDEINALHPESTGGGGSGNKDQLDYDAMFKESPVSQWIQDMVNSADFSSLGTFLADKINQSLGRIDWTRIRDGARRLANSFLTFLNGFFEKLDPAVLSNTISGIINSAATFVNHFWSGTDWEMIGGKIKTSLLNALRNIDVAELAGAVMGKFKALVKFVAALLPSTKEEWKLVGDRMAEFITEAINNIPVSEIATIISGVITGALRLIQSLADEQTLTKLMNAITETLRQAAAGITPEDIQHALGSLLKDIGGALAAALKLNLNIGEIEVNAVGLILTAAAVYNAIKGVLGAIFTSTLLGSGRGLAITAGIIFALSAIAQTIDLVEKIKNGESVTVDDVAGIVQNALMGAGLFLLATGNIKTGIMMFGFSIGVKVITDIVGIAKNLAEGESVTVEDVANILSDSLQTVGLFLLAGGHPIAGLITFGVGIAINPVIKKIGELTTANAGSITDVVFGENWQTELDTAFAEFQGKGMDLDQILYELWGMFGNLTGMSVNMSQFMALLNYSMEGIRNYDGAIDTVDELKVAFENLFGLYAWAQNSGSTMSMGEFFMATLVAMGLVTDETNSASTAMGTLNESITTTSGTLETFNENVDTSGIQSEFGEAATAAENATPSIKATSDAAGDLGTKVVEIPTERSIAIDIVNYDTLISNLDTVNTDISTITSSVETLRLKIASDLTIALTALETRLNGRTKDAFGSMTTAVNTVKDAVNKLQQAIDNLHGTSVNISVNAGLSAGARRFLSLLARFDASIYSGISQLLGASQFTGGGYPNSGDLFIANENGRQEMVGRIGNRNAVANQDQIGDAIFQYMDEHDRQSGDGPSADEIGTAVANALKRVGIGSVYLDGRDLARSINRESQRAGHPVINF